ncbi:LamG domain-containing protein [Patescibacteria group bacterium]|nr:LamG domain-containing protein [Patescibacteria group bacterium]
MKISRDFIFDSSLVLYLPLWKLDGASFMSRDHYGHICTVTGAIRCLNSWFLDGIDDKFLIPHCSILNITSDITFEAWVKRDPAQADVSGVIVCKSWTYDFKVDNDGTLTLAYYNGATWVLLAAAGVVPPNEWTHIARTRAIVGGNTSNILLVNRNPIASGTLTGLPASTTNNVELGRHPGAAVEDYRGLIGEACVYCRRKSPLEIQHNYLATKWRHQ